MLHAVKPEVITNGPLPYAGKLISILTVYRIWRNS